MSRTVFRLHLAVCATMAAASAGSALALAPSIPACGSVTPVDAMLKVRSGNTTLDPPGLTGHLAAARGGIVYLQALVKTRDPVTPAELTVQATVPGAPDFSVGVRLLHYTDLNVTFAASNAPGRYPDALLPEEYWSADVVAKPATWAVFWLSVAVPAGAPPGIHQGVISVSTKSGTCGMHGRFSLKVSQFRMPAHRSQLTGAEFSQANIQAFNKNPENMTMDSILGWFRSMAQQGINSLVWFSMDSLPFAPRYTISADRQSVKLDTVALEKWFPVILNVTGAKHWRMPFSARIHSAPHVVETNATWTFRGEGGEVFTVPIFKEGHPGTLDPEFERLFLMLFRAVDAFMERVGWAVQGSWVQVSDEPTWTDPVTLNNSLALMKLYRNVSKNGKIFQTRYPEGTGSTEAETGARTPAARPEAYTDLIDQVDWWCVHVCQWSYPGVPAELAAIRANRERQGREFHVTVYDNGVPPIESPWERVRSQGLDVWRSNGTAEGTLSWYSINSYGLHRDSFSGKFRKDPWLNPYPSPKHGAIRDPAGFGFQMWPPPPTFQGKSDLWEPVESVRWMMLGQGIDDAAIAASLDAKGVAPELVSEARNMLATGFPHRWNSGCNDLGKTADWGDDGYHVDRHPQALRNGSSTYNNWRLAALEALDAPSKPTTVFANIPEQIRLSLAPPETGVGSSRRGLVGVVVSWITPERPAGPTGVELLHSGSDLAAGGELVPPDLAPKPYRYDLKNYTSGWIARSTLWLPPSTLHYYVVQASASERTATFSFVSPPAPGTPGASASATTAKQSIHGKQHPAVQRIAFCGDLGQTVNSSRTVSHILEPINNTDPSYWDAIVIVGDMSYADSQKFPNECFHPGGCDPERWDSWGRMYQPLGARVPTMVVPGNHEVEVPTAPLFSSGSNTQAPFTNYLARFPMPAPQLYFSYELGLAHIVHLNSYDYFLDPGAFNSSSRQLAWLRKDLRAVNRTMTPWVIVCAHSPWYNSNTAHHNEREEVLLRKLMEPVLFAHGVDLVFAGHVHAYERMFPVYANITNKTGAPTYINIGDGGNREGPADKYLNKPEWSAFREPIFGHGELKILSASVAEWYWHRNPAAERSKAADAVRLLRPTPSPSPHVFQGGGLVATPL